MEMGNRIFDAKSILNKSSQAEIARVHVASAIKSSISMEIYESERERFQRRKSMWVKKKVNKEEGNE